MTRSVNLLIMEDNKTDLAMLVHELRCFGFELSWETAVSREDFIARLDAAEAFNCFDVILADYSLPGYNALAALQELKTRCITTPLIIVTGSLEDEAAIQCLKHGAADFLLKDRLHRLGPAVERALEERQEILERDRIAAELEAAKRKAARALERANAELESRIAERTRELTEANEKLMAEVCQRERMQEALQQAQKLQAIGNLSAGIAHHFNNLLTVVIGNLEMAMMKPLDPVVLERLEAAHHASRTGARLTRQLLSFSRQQLIQPELVEPSLRLADTGALLSGLLREDLQVEIDLQAGLWPVRVDFAELELAILNLAFNARDALRSGGTIRLAATNQKVKDKRLGIDGRYLVVEVADDGDGIPENVLPNVFDPFFTTKEVGEGSGLGLSQVHGFVHQAGGAVDIQSRPGEGTTVRLYLPVIAHEQQSVDEAKATAGLDPSGRILIVDDEVMIAQLSGHILREDGFEVELTFQADQALAALGKGRKFDLIVSDIVMPGMSGIELAERVREQFPQMPILLVTGHTDAGQEVADRNLPVLAKPFSPATLARRVRTLLDRDVVESQDAPT